MPGFFKSHPLVEKIRSLTPKLRVEFARENETEIETTCVRSYNGVMVDLEEIGRLLCHGSSIEMRQEYPIDGDVNDTEQQKFERSILGSADERQVEGAYSFRSSSDENGREEWKHE